MASLIVEAAIVIPQPEVQHTGCRCLSKKSNERRNRGHDSLPVIVALPEHPKNSNAVQNC